MSYTLLFTKQSFEDIKKLDSTVKRQIKKKILHFSQVSDIKVVAKKLHDFDGGEYRIRVGDYRVIFDLDKHVLVILRIQHRKDIYR